MNKDSVPPVTIGPPRRSRADFFLPPRPAKNLDAAEIRIVGVDPSEGTSASQEEAQARARRVIESLND